MKQKVLEKYARNYGPYAVIAVLFIIAVIPLLLRGSNGDPITPGIESYSYLRHADLINQGIIGYEPISNEPVFLTPYTALLALLGYFGLAWALAPLLVGLFILVLYIFLSGVVKQKFVIFVTLVALLLSPTFSVLSTAHSPIVFASLFLLLALLFSKKSLPLTVVTIALGTATDPLLGIIMTLYLFVVFVNKKNFVSALGVLLALVIPILWEVLWVGRADNIRYLIQFAPMFFEFGARGGISLFFIVLAAFGVFTKRIPFKKQIFWSTLGLLLVSMFLPILIPVVTIFLAYLIGYAVFDLFVEPWNLDLLRHLSLVLVFCIAFLLVAVSVKDRASELPDSVTVDRMVTIGVESHEGKVLTHPSYEPIVIYYSGREATVNSDSSAEEIRRAFFTRQPEIWYMYLEETSTGFIYVDKHTRNDIFSRSDEGILFILLNTNRFVQISKQPDSSAWYYIPRTSVS